MAQAKAALAESTVKKDDATNEMLIEALEQSVLTAGLDHTQLQVC